jgi:hypothetical protein
MNGKMLKLEDAALCGGRCLDLVQKHLQIGFYNLNDGKLMEAVVTPNTGGVLALSPPDRAYISKTEQFTFSIKAKSDSFEAQSFINSLIIHRFDEVHYVQNNSIQKVS